jgi:hypothetical protein
VIQGLWPLDQSNLEEQPAGRFSICHSRPALSIGAQTSSATASIPMSLTRTNERSHDAILEFLFGCNADVAQDRACKLGKEAFDQV